MDLRVPQNHAIFPFGKSWASQQSASQPRDLQVPLIHASLCPFFFQKVQSASQPSDGGSILPAMLTGDLEAENLRARYLAGAGVGRQLVAVFLVLAQDLYVVCGVLVCFVGVCGRWGVCVWCGVCVVCGVLVCFAQNLPP